MARKAKSEKNLFVMALDFAAFAIGEIVKDAAREGRRPYSPRQLEERFADYHDYYIERQAAGWPESATGDVRGVER